MPQFHMPLDNQDQINAFHELDEFTQGCVECVFFTIDEELKAMTLGDLSDEALAKLKEDCARFQQYAYAALQAAYQQNDNSGKRYEAKRAGVNFWFTRNGHGAGYWDRDLGDAGKLLSDAARKFGERDVYKGDDGKLYLS